MISAPHLLNLSKCDLRNLLNLSNPLAQSQQVLSVNRPISDLFSSPPTSEPRQDSPMTPSSDAIVEALVRTDIRTLSDTVWRDWNGRLLSPLDRYLVTSAEPEHFAAARTQILTEYQRLREEAFHARALGSLWQELVDLINQTDAEHHDITIADTLARMSAESRARAEEVVLLIEAMRS